MTDKPKVFYALAVFWDYPKPNWSVSARLHEDEERAREYYKRELDGSYCECRLAKVEIME